MLNLSKIDIKFERWRNHLYFMYLKTIQAQQLEFEVLSPSLKVYFTRLLHQYITTDGDGDLISNGNQVIISRQNYFINKARQLQNRPIYVLEADDHGMYHPAEFDWHSGEFALAFRRLTTLELIEYIGDLISEEVFSIQVVNKALKKDGASFEFVRERNKLHLEVKSDEAIKTIIADIDNDPANESFHSNIRLLLLRANSFLELNDASGVIHTCATIFESLAKELLDDQNLDNQTLGGFFQKYRTNSSLPEPIINYILEIYKDRNTTPLAGHGSRLAPPQVSPTELVTLIELTKAFIKIEYISFEKASSTQRRPS